MKRQILFSVILFLMAGELVVAQNQHSSWKDFGGSADMSRYVVQDEITKDNIKQLKQAWFYPTDDNRTYRFNPLIVDTVMYVMGKRNSIIALNAKTGEEIWIHANLNGIGNRGLNYWESEDGSDKRLLFTMNNYLQAINAETGKSILDFGENGLVDLKQELGRDPSTLGTVQSRMPGKVFDDLLLVGSSPGENYLSAPGHIRAYNVITGEMEWIFHTIPQPGEYGYETWPPEAYKYVGGVNTWGEISVDVERGIAYFPLGSPTYDYYGADRKGKNLFGNSILALDARTGKRLWHYQMVHHDLWDYDPSAAPQLITVNHDGKEIDAVAVIPKHGFVFVFDRVTGEPLWPIEERPVPPSDVPGEEAWPTQPFPTQPPPASRLSFTSEDISPYLLTDEERESWKAHIDTVRKELFTPLSHKEPTLTFPGAVGGVGWGNTASNPEDGTLYVFSIAWPSFYEPLRKVELPKNQQEEIEKPAERPSGGMIYSQLCQACHGANRGGLIGPALEDLEQRLDFSEFQTIMTNGSGEMPAFPQYDETDLKELYAFLSDVSSSEINETEVQDLPEGPVVAWGGAPGGQVVRRPGWWRRGPEQLYPEGSDTPDVRYYTDGWGLGYAYVISPPWSSITAYDLNKGTIKWRRPVGNDRLVALEGGSNTGVIQAQRHGMIITSNGLLFSTSRDGKVYAFDTDNGDELWSGNLPTGSEGLPAMYEIDGKQYLVVTATTSLKFGRAEDETDEGFEEEDYQRGYVVFSLSNN